MLNLRYLLLLILFLHPALQGLNGGPSGGLLAAWSPFGIAAILIVYLSLVYFLIKRKMIIKGLFSFNPFFLLLCAALASIFISEFPVFSLKDFLELSSIFVVYILGANLFGSKERLKILANVIIASSVIPLAAALFQAASKSGSLEDNVMRAKGTLSHPNELGFYLLLTFPLLAGNLTREESGKSARISIPVLILCALTIYALKCTYTRGAWIAFALEMAVLWFFSRRKVPALAAVSSLCGVALLAMPDIIARFTSISSQHSSFFWRLETWKILAQIAMKRPVAGYGIGTSAFIYDKFGYQLKVPHNDYLRVFLEMGAAGTAAYVWLWVSIFISGWYFFRKAGGDVFLKRAGAAFIAVSVAYAVSSAADNLFNNSLLLWPFFCFAGALAGIYGKKPRQKEGVCT